MQSKKDTHALLPGMEHVDANGVCFYSTLMKQEGAVRATQWKIKRADRACGHSPRYPWMIPGMEHADADGVCYTARWCMKSKPLPTTGVCIGKEVAYKISTSNYRSDVKLHLVWETTDNRSVVSEQQLFCPMRTTGVWLRQDDTTIKCCC